MCCQPFDIFSIYKGKDNNRMYNKNMDELKLFSRIDWKRRTFVKLGLTKEDI